MPLSAPQQTIADDPHRWRVAICGRRFGKTHLAIRELAYHAREPGREVLYCAPSYRQAKSIVWKKLKYRLEDLNWVKKTNETELSILLKNGSTISLKGLDNYDSVRGGGYDFLVIDEFADCDPEAWYSVLRATLSDRQGRALFIGTPRGMANWAHDLYLMEQEYPNEWKSFSYTTLQGGNVTAEEIESARRDLDARTFREEYEATFESAGNRVYYSFDRLRNIKLPPQDTANADLLIGTDFNLDPLCSVVMVRQGDDLYIIDEIRIFGSNTDELVDEIKQRYSNRKITVFPDPAGHQRRTSSAGRTDVTILKNAGFVVKAPYAHTPVRDRINAVNSRLCNSMGQSRLFVSPTCKYTIEGFERQTYKSGSNQPDKSSGYDHMMDAVGYAVDFLFPIREQIEPRRPESWGHKLARY